MREKNIEVRGQRSEVGRKKIERGTFGFRSLLPAPCSLRSVFFGIILILGLLIGPALAVDGDIVFKREGGEGGVAVAVFPHWFHRIRYKCYACHPSVFEMKAGANKVTMDAIGEGKFCGVCHNGKIAWAASFETCNRCHAEK